MDQKSVYTSGSRNIGLSVLFLVIFINLSDHAESNPLSPSTTTVLQHHRSKELVFSEEFYDLDPEVWYHEITPPGHKNGEFQSYFNSPENSYVRDGILYIKPTLNLEKYGGMQKESRRNRSITFAQPSRNRFSPPPPSEDVFNPIMSARLNTRRAFAFQYGQLEVRAKLPQGDWIWPAIWLLPQQQRYGSWPVSGEIDIMECRSNLKLFTSSGENIGVQQMGSTLHFGMDRKTDMWRLAHFTRSDPAGYHSKFHVYGMTWSPDEFAFTLDGEVIGVVKPPKGGFWEMGKFNGSSVWSEDKMSPFDQPFNLILNVAVGGTSGYFPDNTRPTKKPWKNASPTALLDFWEARDEWMPTWKEEESALQVDYVRIWAL